MRRISLALVALAIGLTAGLPSGSAAGSSFAAPPLAPLAGTHACIVDGDWFDPPPRTALGCQVSTGPAHALAGQLTQVDIAPDGLDVYVVGNQVGLFRRDPATGQLRENGCIDTPPDDRSVPPVCVVPPPLAGIDRRLAQGPFVAVTVVSPDGRDLYIVWRFQDRSGRYRSTIITWFLRNPATGALSYQGCLSGDGTGGLCSASGMLDGWVAALHFSRDGERAFAQAAPRALGGSETLVGFARAPATGQLTVVACATTAPERGGCGPFGRSTGAYGAGVALSSNGRTVYVAGSAGLTRLRLTEDGQLGGTGCWRHRPHVPGCQRLPGMTGWIYDLALSRDGRYLYAASFTNEESVVGALRISRGRRLRLADCLDRKGRAPCRSAPGILTNGGTLAVAESELIVAGSGGFGEGADVAILHVRAPGRLSVIGCASARREPPCVRVRALSRELSPMAASPDGRNIYASPFPYPSLVALGRSVAISSRAHWQHRRRDLRIRLACPTPRKEGCRGTLRVRVSGSPTTLRPYAVAAGSSVTVTVHVGRRAARRVDTGHSVDIVATDVAHAVASTQAHLRAT